MLHGLLASNGEKILNDPKSRLPWSFAEPHIAQCGVAGPSACQRQHLVSRAVAYYDMERTSGRFDYLDSRSGGHDFMGSLEPYSDQLDFSSKGYIVLVACFRGFNLLDASFAGYGNLESQEHSIFDLDARTNCRVDLDSCISKTGVLDRKASRINCLELRNDDHELRRAEDRN